MPSAMNPTTPPAAQFDAASASSSSSCPRHLLPPAPESLTTADSPLLVTASTMWRSVLEPPLPAPRPSSPLPIAHPADVPSPGDHLPTHSPMPPTPLPPLPNLPPPPSPPSSSSPSPSPSSSPSSSSSSSPFRAPPESCAPPSHPYSASSPSDPLASTLGRLVQRLPPAQFVAAYGSGAFPQGVRDASDPPQFDLLIAVDEPLSWHAQNLELNPSHYSSIARAGAAAVVKIQEGFPAFVYYNTHCPLDEHLVKYGVISTPQLYEDLTQWSTLYCAGRLQKPVRVLTPPPTGSALTRGLDVNLRGALAAALLIWPERHVTDSGLFAVLTSLSYAGDVRSGIAEHPDKVMSIVRGSFAEFQGVYAPFMRRSGWMVEEGESDTEWGVKQRVWGVNRGVEEQRAMLQSLPPVPLRVMEEHGRSEGEWKAHVGPHLQAAMASIVAHSSSAQLIKGVYTAGIRKSVQYGLRKLLKRWK